jgi:hypothetical protein
VGSLSTKQIVVPDMGTIAKVFTHHLHTLKQLKHKIDLLRQASDMQLDSERTREQLHNIVSILDDATLYLSPNPELADNDGFMEFGMW